jgi:hypothetical protein
MKQSLKSALIKKFSKIELNESQLTQLIDTDLADVGRSYNPVVKQLLVCCSIVLMLVFGNYSYQSYSAHNLLDSIANEMVNNHLKQKPLEVKSDDISIVLNYFTELDFNPLRVSGITGVNGDQLLGARYCSIKGVTAAQFRIRNADGTLASLYQGVLPEKQLNLIPKLKSGEQGSVHNIKGVKVEIWRNKGVVFVSVASHD